MKLTLLTVPIGNLSDISSRGLKKLHEGKNFLCEDTRSFKNLLSHFEISLKDKNIESYHDQSSLEKLTHYLEQSRDSEVIYVSEAGSPIVSDPGHLVVKTAYELGYQVDTIPGATSLIAALELSGLPAEPFHFHGFLSRTKGKMEHYLKKCGAMGGTHIFFESPRRILETLELLSATLPDANVAVCRELTKMYQETYRFKSCYLGSIRENITEKGEFIVLFFTDDRDSGDITSSELKNLAQAVLDDNGKARTLSKLLAKMLGQNSKEVYSLLTNGPKKG